MNELEFSFLCACQELVIRQNELLPDLTEALGIPQTELYYAWMTGRVDQCGQFLGGEWRYFFHGLECDLGHWSDGRFVRVDFGPHGRTDTFTGWGVMQFVMTSRSPWRCFPELQAYLANRPPPYDGLSGSHGKMVALAARLEELGLVAPADLELCAFEQQHTVVEPSGRRVWRFPAELPDQAALDLMVCHRWVLSARGRQTIAAGDLV
jgi:uncharacterized protein DUF6896